MPAATEEMITSISEISRSAATAAVSTAQITADAVTRLDQAGSEIGDILKAINSIAQQTNLLALNATIEAARAGNAGRFRRGRRRGQGFAVGRQRGQGASSWSPARSRTRRRRGPKPTQDIARKTAAIQSTTTDVSQRTRQITDVVNQINELRTTIAVAVEQRSATATDISRNVGQVSAGIARNITGVAAAAESTAQGGLDPTVGQRPPTASISRSAPSPTDLPLVVAHLPGRGEETRSLHNLADDRNTSRGSSAVGGWCARPWGYGCAQPVDN
jgi:methyl-accepting chemotaxis protein